MAEPRRVAVVTGTRAEYGLLRPVLQRLATEPTVDLQLIACGMHLAPEFGHTIDHIERDGFSVSWRLDTLVAGDSPSAAAKSLGLGTLGFIDAFVALRPHLLVLLGDRLEILAAAQAALPLRLPIAHLHGGEATEGAMDEAIRHAVTKLAHLHFTATEAYRRRVIQLGEQPDRVFNVGATAVDNVCTQPLLERSMLEEALGWPLTGPLFLVTYHPPTLGQSNPDHGIRCLLQALDDFPEARLVFTKANSDPGGRRINTLVQSYCTERPHRARLFDALGVGNYLSVARIADAVVGNSSSGIIEVPVLGTPTVNIGPRQRGRIRPPSVIDAEESVAAIATAIRHAMSEEHRVLAATKQHPYGDGRAAERIACELAMHPLEGITAKSFFDVAEA